MKGASCSKTCSDSFQCCCMFLCSKHNQLQEALVRLLALWNLMLFIHLDPLAGCSTNNDLGFCTSLTNNLSDHFHLGNLILSNSCSGSFHLQYLFHWQYFSTSKERQQPVLQYLPCILLDGHSTSLLSYSCARDCDLPAADHDQH